MVNVKHEESVQVAVCQTAMTEESAFIRRCLVKLIAAEDECRQIVLQVLCKGHQLFSIRLLSPCFLGSLFLQLLLFQQELLVFRIVQPRLYGHGAFGLAGLHCCNDGSAGIDAPLRTRFPDLLPEHFLCARKCLREVRVFLITESSHGLYSIYDIIVSDLFRSLLHLVKRPDDLRVVGSDDLRHFSL